MNQLSNTYGNYGLFVKKIILNFLQRQFSAFDLKWDRNFKNTQIFILDQFAYSLGSMDLSPAIIVRRGPLREQVLGISDGLLSTDVIEGSAKRTFLLNGSMQLNCIGKMGIEAEYIANVVFNLIKGYKKQIGYHSISNLTIGPETPLKVDTQVSRSVVPVEFSFTKQITIENVPKFNYITIKYSVNHIPEEYPATHNIYIDPKVVFDWEEPIQEKLMECILIEGRDFFINTDGNIEFFNSPVKTYYIKEGESSVEGPDDGSVPKPGASKDYKISGFLPKGSPVYSVNYLDATTLDFVDFELSADGEKKIFMPLTPIYGYASLFKDFIVN